MRFFLLVSCMASLVACGGSDGFVFAPGDDGGAEVGAAGGDAMAVPVSPGHGQSAGDGGSNEASMARGSTVDAAAVSNNRDAAPASTTDATAAATADTGGPIAVDAGGDIGAGRGADASTPVPGFVACGGSTCNETTQFCCVTGTGAETCQTTDQACQMLGGARRECDKASDCQMGNVCCLDFSNIPATASCQGDCSGGGGTRVQACRTQTECLAGTCAIHACAAGGSIQSCAPFAPECP